MKIVSRCSSRRTRPWPSSSRNTLLNRRAGELRAVARAAPAAAFRIYTFNQMAVLSERRDLMFPKLERAQLARLMSFGIRRQVQAGELIFDQGQAKRSFFV